MTGTPTETVVRKSVRVRREAGVAGRYVAAAT